MFFAFDTAQAGDSRELLGWLPDSCAALVHFDPQYRGTLNRLAYGNEGVRQRERCRLPQMDDDLIESCLREAARVLRPSGYAALWSDAYNLCTGLHRRVEDVLPCVDLACWDNKGFGMGP